jgi:hypothetical protein
LAAADYEWVCKLNERFYENFTKQRSIFLEIP